MSLFKATESFDATYEGFNVDDFMRTVMTLTIWNAQGRRDAISSADKVKAMIDEGYIATETNIGQIRNEIEV